MIARRSAASRGFTLMEVLVVLALVGMLTGSVLAFLWDLWGRRDTLLRDSTDAQAGSAVVERIESDILSGLAGDQGAGAGVKGTGTTLKLLSRGVDLPVNGRGSTSGDLQGSEYQFQDGMLKARRWNIGGSSPDFETVCDHVEAMRLRYFDGREWRESFDSLSAGTLPVAVEVAMWFGTPRADPNESEPREATKPRGGAVEVQQDEAAPPKPEPPAAALPTRQPDRLRVIVVPDGPVAAWKESR